MNYLGIDNNKLHSIDPAMNKIGLETYVHWILYNYKKKNNINIDLIDNKISRNVIKIIDQNQVFEIYRNKDKISKHYISFFKQVEQFEKFSDVIANSIIYRIFNSIEAQENIGFIRESRYDLDRLINKISKLEIKNFIKNKEVVFEDELETSLEIVSILEFIYENNIHNKIIEYNDNICIENLNKTILLLEKIPFVTKSIAYEIYVDICNLESYKYQNDLYLYISKKEEKTLTELFDKYNTFNFIELTYWIYKENDKLFSKYGYEINNILKDKLDLPSIKRNLNELLEIIKLIYNDNIESEYRKSPIMEKVDGKHRSDNSYYKIVVANGRVLDM